MRRILLSGCLGAAALACLPAAASAAPFVKDVRADIRNDTDQGVTLGYHDRDGRYGTIDLAPGQVADDVNNGFSDLTVSLENCGPARVKLGNPLAGAPGVSLTADGAGLSEADSDSFDEGERHNERFQGVLITTVRQPDTSGWKNFDIAIKACRAAAVDTMTPVAEEQPAFLLPRFVRATVRNSTGKPADVGYGQVSTSWQGLRLAPGATSPSIGMNERTLTLTLPDCGPARLWFANDAALTPSVALKGERWVLGNRSLDEGESTTFTRDGNRITVTREDDSSGAKRFAVDLLHCDGK